MCEILGADFLIIVGENRSLLIILKNKLFFPYKSMLLQFEIKYIFCYILKIHVH